MSTRSELTEYDRTALYLALDGALTDEALKSLQKKARDLTDSIVEDIEFNLRDNLASNLSWHVHEMAGRAVEALLEGNQDEMVRWLRCDNRRWNGRSDAEHGDREIERQHPVIHGKLFEQGCVLLRKKIVEAHKDLLASERMLDLEDQVKSLVAQNNKLEREKDEWIRRAQGCEATP